MVDVSVHDSADQAAHDAAIAIRDHVLTCVDHKQPCRLGLATGGTPLPVYRDLVRWVRSDRLRFDDVTTFNLDEYVGLAPDHPQSYHEYMRQNLFDEAGIRGCNAFLPIGSVVDPNQEARRYESLVVDAGGPTMQLLGIGRNGHIGFNEPGSPLDSITRVVDLADDTIAANSRYFQDISEVPRQAITMGIGTILRSHSIIVLATGLAKADAVARAIQDPVDASHPASALQLHSRVRWILDREAASLLHSDQ
ncbi:MAG: glucosamine-6-phosphate deaminase [Planctomycetota bacterium]